MPWTAPNGKPAFGPHGALDAGLPFGAALSKKQPLVFTPQSFRESEN